MPHPSCPRQRAAILLVAAALALAACGGGSAPAPAPAPAALALIATQPVAQSVIAGQSATFLVAASSNGLLSYQWRRECKDIPGATGASYTLASAQAADNGASFTVVVKNGGGSVTSAAAILKVTAVSTTGQLSLLAGPQGDSSGNAGGVLNGSVDGKGMAARFSGSNAAWPASSLYPDAQGDIFVADGARVRKITPAGDVSTLALPSTGPDLFPITYYTTGYAGGGKLLAFNAGIVSRVDANGNFEFLAGHSLQVGAKASLTDGVGAKASFYDPKGFVADAQGALYCLDMMPPRFTDDPVQVFVIRKIVADGTVTTLPVANMSWMRSWFVDRDGRLVMANQNGAVLRLEPDNSLSTLRAALAPGPSGSIAARTVVAGDRGGNLYIADYIQSYDPAVNSKTTLLHKITPAGADTILAGTAGTGAALLGGAPGDDVQSLAIGDDGAIYIMSTYVVLRLTQ